LDGKYEIRSPKDETTSLIYKKNGVWGIEAKNEQGQIVLLPLNDTDVIKSLNSWMLGPIKK
jgi:hypothetical protein